MNQETKNCQNCKEKFTIEPEDFQFYEKVAVPAPTQCSDCRQQRRYAWRNERVFYRRNCDLCNKSTVTIYSPNKPYKVYCPPCWWSDSWDAFQYGQDFNFSRPFFEQFQELQLKAPRIALLTKNSVNSEYTNHSGDNKNCYLCISTFNSENCLYTTNVWDGAKDSMDCYRIEGKDELLYECIDSQNCYQCQYGMLLKDCTDCLYCYDCRGCSYCFLSVNLRNKQYHILNISYTKEEYFKKLNEYRLGSFAERKRLYDRYLELIKEKALHKFTFIERSNNVSGNMIINSKNSHHIFDATAVEDTKYGIICLDLKDSMDSYHYGFACEIIYESHAVVHGYNILFSHLCYDDSHLAYCDTCHNSENLFGCVSIKKGQYCIFNKQYSEAGYKELKEKIINHMRSTGEYGEFFPVKFSPFGYNETQGQVYMPLSKEEVQKRGWKWENVVPGTFGKETIKSEDIPDDINDVQDSIIDEALTCIECSKNYNIVKPELDLYRRMKVPIPRLCPDCRYLQRITLRLPRQLWHRQCMCNYQVYKNTTKHPHHPEGKCPNEFETSYDPKRKEIVYCEACYQAEVV